jgi:urease accessory protein
VTLVYLLLELYKPVAHTGTGSGAMAGFLHPLIGLEHLLAMVTVGLLSAQLGGRAIWSVPATFVGVMALGGMLGLAGVNLPLVKFGIAVSVLVLGIALLAKAGFPEWLAMAFVALFAVFHGHAHGADLPAVTSAIDVIAYVVGFLVSTAGLHVIGALVGYISLRSDRGSLLLRGSGLAIALVGAYFMLGAING